MESGCKTFVHELIGRTSVEWRGAAWNDTLGDLYMLWELMDFTYQISDLRFQIAILRFPILDFPRPPQIPQISKPCVRVRDTGFETRCSVALRSCPRIKSYGVRLQKIGACYRGWHWYTEHRTYAI